MGWYNFESLFEKSTIGQKKTNPKTAERKVFYSSARKNKSDIDFADSICEASQSSNKKFKDIFTTPKGHKMASNTRHAMTSTRLTKGGRQT
jgi:hypothetical protein